jgi:hypothetical protein
VLRPELVASSSWILIYQYQADNKLTGCAPQKGVHPPYNDWSVRGVCRVYINQRIHGLRESSENYKTIELTALNSAEPMSLHRSSRVGLVRRRLRGKWRVGNNRCSCSYNIVNKSMHRPLESHPFRPVAPKFLAGGPCVGGDDSLEDRRKVCAYGCLLLLPVRWQSISELAAPRAELGVLRRELDNKGRQKLILFQECGPRGRP